MYVFLQNTPKAGLPLVTAPSPGLLRWFVPEVSNILFIFPMCPSRWRWQPFVHPPQPLPNEMLELGSVTSLPSFYCFHCALFSVWLHGRLIHFQHQKILHCPLSSFICYSFLKRFLYMFKSSSKISLFSCPLFSLYTSAQPHIFR